MPIRVFAAAAAIAALAAQPNSARFDGRVVSDRDLHTYSVEVFSRFSERVPLARDGAFTLYGTPGETVDLRVIDTHGDRVQSETVLLRSGHFLEFRLREPARHAPAPGGPVSIGRLTHRPSKQSRRLFETASRLSAKGALRESAGALERAVAGDSGWMEAWANLGSVRLKLGDFAGAESAFRHGLEIDPNAAVLHSNLGLALLFLKRPSEAERHGREALRQAPGDARANYVTGLALLHQRKIEGVALLEKAAEELPAAKEVLRRLPPAQ